MAARGRTKNHHLGWAVFGMIIIGIGLFNIIAGRNVTLSAIGVVGAAVATAYRIYRYKTAA